MRRRGALERLLRAVHIRQDVFEALTAQRTPCVPVGVLGRHTFSLPVESGGFGLCLARQITAPPCLSFRLNTQHGVGSSLLEEMLMEMRRLLGTGVTVESHPVWSDVISVSGRRSPEPHFPSVLTSARAGEGVLRGSHLWSKDIFATLFPRLAPGAQVSVFAAARDTPAFSRGSDSEVDEIATIVEELVHTRYLHGSSGNPTEAIFVGNGTWTPPHGVKMTAAHVRTVPLVGMGAASAVGLPKSLVPQTAPSAATVHILGPQPGERVLDLCAAPGGKTQHISQLMGNSGSIVAVELSQIRLERMQAFLNASGARNVECVHADGSLWRSPTKQLFDRALVDAPCSSMGLWPRLDWRRITLRGIEELAKQQVALLRTACREVKPGGTIVYSVCSYHPQETEKVCHTALAELPLELDTDEVPGPLWTAKCDAMGFFVAKFRRVSSAGSGARVPVVRRSRGRRLQ